MTDATRNPTPRAIRRDERGRLRLSDLQSTAPAKSTSNLVALASLVFIFLSTPAHAQKSSVKFTSFYRAATVFRDRNGDGQLTPGLRKPERSIQTNDDGSFVPPLGSGRLYLQGGTDIQTGQPNNLLLAAPPGARSIGTLTSLWQALLDRRSKTFKSSGIPKLLGIPKGTRLIDFAAVDSPQANDRQGELLNRDAKQHVLVTFFKALASRSSAREPNLRGRSATDETLDVRSDPAIDALAYALIQSKKAAVPDLSNSDAVKTLFRSAEAALPLDLTSDEQITAATAAASINGGIDRNLKELKKLRKITGNAGRVLTLDDYFSLKTRYTGTGLDRQVSGALYLPSARFEPVSVAWNGGETDGVSNYPAVSSDGRYVAFESEASNLVSSDLNGKMADIFLRDLASGTTTVISRAIDGSAANGPSGIGLTGTALRMSINGRFIAFASEATNLDDAFDLSGGCGYDVCRYLYVYDRDSGLLSLQSLTLDRQPMGIQYFSMDSEGQALVYNGVSTDGGVSGSFVHNLSTDTIEQLPVPPIPPSCVYPEVSRDGRVVLCGGYVVSDFVLYDRIQRALASYGPLQIAGTSDLPFLEGSGSSLDNRFVLHCTNATNFAEADGGGLFLLDTQTRTQTLIDPSQNVQGSCGGTLDRDGNYIAFSPARATTVSETEYAGGSLFLRDRLIGNLTVIAANSTDGSTVIGPNSGHWPVLSEDRQYLVFSADRDVYAASNWTQAAGP